MHYIVLEIQKTDKIAMLSTSYDDRNAAESKFHAVLAAAAISKVPLHSAVIMTETGKVLNSETYSHEEE